MFPFKSLLLESLWSTTASFEPQDQKQKLRFGFLRAWLWLSKVPHAAEECGRETPASPRDEICIKAESALPKCAIFVKYSRVCDHSAKKTFCACPWRAPHWSPRLPPGQTLGTQSSFFRITHHPLNGWHCCSHSSHTPGSQFCLVVPFQHPTGHPWPFNGPHSPSASHTSFYFKYPFAPNATDAFWDHLKTEGRQN